jgi:hypothetical protein
MLDRTKANHGAIATMGGLSGGGGGGLRLLRELCRPVLDEEGMSRNVTPPPTRHDDDGNKKKGIMRTHDVMMVGWVDTRLELLLCRQSAGRLWAALGLEGSAANRDGAAC